MAYCEHFGELLPIEGSKDQRCADCGRTVPHYDDLFEFLRIEGDGELVGFDFSKYWSGEQNILKPALERRGFTQVAFFDGERDSFGPLSRIVTATDAKGQSRKFIYG